MIAKAFLIVGLTTAWTAAQEVVSIWPKMAPGETTASPGEKLPANPKDPSITRIKDITKPTITSYLPTKEKSTGAAVVILPGGGFNYVVPDLEGSETAKFLNDSGVAVFVLNYRTKTKASQNEPWKRPLQDAQRAVRYLRAHREKYGLDSKKIGILAFSAGGQVGAIHMGDVAPAYEKIDEVDNQNHRPEFAMLIYPWRTLDQKSEKLIPQIKLSASAPPTFIVHTSDDASTSLGAVEIYAQLKRAKVSAELHVYQNGGHGYGSRNRENSAIGTWPQMAKAWLRVRGLGK